MVDLLLNGFRTLNDLLSAGIAITAFSLLLYALSCDGAAIRRHPASFQNETHSLKPWHLYAHNPIEAKRNRLIGSLLRSHLKKTLPDYMIPSAFVVLDALPLTSNGKIDRKALPAPDQNRAWLQETFVAPRTEVEELLAQIWSDVLRLDKVGVHDISWTSAVIPY